MDVLKNPSFEPGGNFPLPAKRAKKKRATFVREPASFKLCEL